jgi:hypothetical protein
MGRYRADDLITQVKDETQSPPGWEDSKILRFINSELSSTVFPLIVGVSEDYFVKYKDISNASTGVLLTARMGGGLLREVKYFTGTVSRQSDLSDLARVSLDEIQTNGFPGFYVQGNRLFTTPDNSFTGKLRLYYYHRPSELVLESACATITAIDTTNKKVTVSSVPTPFTTSKTFDFVQANPQFDALGIDLSVTLISSNNITFSSSLPSGLAVGDYVCLAEQSPVPQIPFEAFDLLVYGAALRLCRAAKDVQGIQIMAQAVEQEKQNVKGMLQPRVEGAPQMVTGSGLFRYRP